MGFLKMFFNKAPEKIEQKGDAFLKASDWGRAKLEFEKALDALEKTSSDDASETRLRDKLVQAKDALAHEHRQTGENLMEAEYYDEARGFLQLALELTRDPALISAVEKLMQEIARLTAGDMQMEVPQSDLPPLADDETYTGDQDDETFMALCSALPEEMQEAYLSYGESFKTGFLALNRGDFDLAADALSRALEENPAPDSIIPLELATAYLNLEKLDEARHLLETFLQHHPDALPGYQVLCEIYWEMGAFDQAETLLADCPDDLKNSLAYVLLRGETLSQAGRHPEAASLYQDFMEVYGWNEPIAVALAGILERLGDLENARDLYAEIMNKCRSCHTRINPLITRRFADISFDLGKHSSVIVEMYHSLVQDDPENAPTYFQKISRIYASMGNDEEAHRFQVFAQQAENGKVR
ncbi:tetratricopeptide repeat protein [Thermodesulfobacteriota bacterium]